jgi:MraZ protein
VFVSTYSHSLDAKHRLILPSKYQPALSSGMYVLKVPGRQLRIYPKDAFELHARKILEQPSLDPGTQEFRRFWFGGAEYVVPDPQGRFVMHEKHRAYIDVSAGAEVALVGAFDYIEVYNATDWKTQSEALEAAVQAEGAKLFAKFGM